METVDPPVKINLTEYSLGNVERVEYSVLLEDEWCSYAINGGNMQRLNLFYFYSMGSGLYRLKVMEMDPSPQTVKAIGDTYYILTVACWSLQTFLRDTEGMSFPLSRIEADTLLSILEKQRRERILDYSVWSNLKRQVEDFEKVFRREAARVSAFSVTPKGIYDTEKLIESPENRFTEHVRKALPSQTLYDFQQAGKCLAFELPTAAAFHTLRGTEFLMIEYYIALTGKGWPLPNNRDWNAYIQHLEKEGADKRITERLNEIRKFVRNPLIHPESNVDPDQALPLFELTGGVIDLMMNEIMKLTPTVTPVASTS